MRTTPACLFLFLWCLSPAIAQHDAALLGKVDDHILNSRYQEALALLAQSLAETPSLVLENRRAEVLTRSGKLQQAARLLEDLLTKSELQADPYIKAITHSNTGYLQLNQGRSDLASASLNAALRAFAACGRQNSVEAAQTLSHIAMVYLSQGKYSQAQEHLHQALALREKSERNRDALMAATYNDLGLAYSQTDMETALDHYRKARRMYTTLYGEDDSRIAIVSINTGVIYREAGLFQDAIEYFETALSIWNNTYPEPHPAKGIALYNLGQTYTGLNDQKAAMEYYQLALRMYNDCYGAKHPEIAMVLNAIGNLHVAMSQFDDALLTYENALQANIQTSPAPNPGNDFTLENYYNGMTLLHTLLFRAQAYEARYARKSLRFSDLKQALDLLGVCDTLVGQLRHRTTNEADKMRLGAMASEVYSDGVRISFIAALNAVNKNSYYERAFYFAEKSKGAVLLESIADANAKSFAGIPPAVLEDETSLRSAMTVNARRLAERPQAEEEKMLREESFDLKRKYEEFVQKLERQYPEYFNLKYNSKTPGVADLQSLLDRETALISYFIDEKQNDLYIFVIRAEGFRVWQRSLGNEFNKYITGIRNGIYFQEIETFKESAYALARTLIPSLPSAVQHLVILPVGRLGVVPFETLLTADADALQDYASLPYLLKEFSVRYEFSAALMFQKSNKRPTSASSIFLCAPVSFPERKHLGTLPGTKKEVRDISRLFTDQKHTCVSLTAERASEKVIKTQTLKDFGFIHLATHGLVDEMNPELSRVFLQAGYEEDGDLYAGEIYNLDLNANLVTLSACQTGMGKIVKGEGVIGLSRALTYAGAANIIVSFWSVADESTTLLMKDFYENILTIPAETYGSSLRASKLRLMNDRTFSAPFYWAPFVLIGF